MVDISYAQKLIEQHINNKQNSVNIDILLTVIMNYCNISKTDVLSTEEIVRAIDEARKIKTKLPSKETLEEKSNVR